MRPLLLPRLSTLVVAMVLCSCGAGEPSIRGKAYDPCLRSLAACPGLFASCVLDPSRYSRVSFPGDFRFLVDADAGVGVQVAIYFAEQRDAGLETLIFWNEPGCSDYQLYDSEGRDLFRASEITRVFKKTKEFSEDGEHLIEIFSDMDALVLVTVEIGLPSYP